MGTVEPPSTAPPWSAAQPPSKGTEKIATIKRILGFFLVCLGFFCFFFTCYSNNLSFSAQSLI